jgi:hypothetical protein
MDDRRQDVRTARMTGTRTTKIKANFHEVTKLMMMAKIMIIGARKTARIVIWKAN